MCKEYVKYKSFDELPEALKEKFKSEARGSNLKRAKDGYVDFINKLNECGDKLVGDYVGVDVKTYVEFGECSHVADITPNNYKHGKGCGICNGKQVQRGVNDLATIHPRLVKEWHPVKNGKLTPHDVTQGSHKKVWWKCEKGHEWESVINNRAKGNNCPYCSNKKVLKGYNDLATSHPHYVKYFANVKDAYTYTYRSNRKVKMKCCDCGHVKHMSVSNLTRYGFSCDICSDGVSYPEKLLASVLSRLNVEFIKQISYDNGFHMYDFYLLKHNTILETHGLQHYEHGFKRFGKTLKEEQENDRVKRELAISNGILSENYHEIDCRYSTLEWCRPNIEKALSNYMNMSMFTDKDWMEIDIQAQKSLKIEVCKHWNENKRENGELSTRQLADVFGVTKQTIIQYLKWGNANGLCVYNTREETEASCRRNSTFVYLIKPNEEKWFDESMSIKELSRKSGISQKAIANNLDKGGLKHHKNSKYDPKYIGSRIVSAEVYDSQIQSN